MKFAKVFSNKLQFVEIVNNFFKINTVISEKNKFDLKLYDYCMWKNIKFLQISNANDKNLFDLEINRNEIGITYGFGIIFNKIIINKFKNGIWNIHPGALPDYRGRHPVSHAFLNNDFFIGVSVHIINHKIDRGKLICQDFVQRSMDDSPNDIEKKIFILLQSSLLNKSIKNFTAKKFTTLKKGKYYPSLINGIKIDDPKNYTALYIFNAFRSQYDFSGVTVMNKKYMRCYFYNPKMNMNKFDKIIKSSDGFMLVIYKNKLLK